MSAWLDRALICLKQHTDVVLITIAEVRGSAPRNAATRMLVSKDDQWLTIGGGNLEWQATAKAREYLQLLAPKKDSLGRTDVTVLQQHNDCLHYAKQNIWFDLFQLGPSLGQCCGGVVGVVFEYLDQADLLWLEFLQQAKSSNIAIKKELYYTPISQSSSNHAVRPNKDCHVSLTKITDAELDEAKNTIYKNLTNAQKLSGMPELSWFKRKPNGDFIHTEFMQPETLDIYVFGAGHVGKALVDLLGTLPCNVVWVDSRTEQFPQSVAPNVTIEETDIPESIIDSAAPNSCYVIMTHDHALDQRLCEQLLKRNDALYFGLIGSHTKRQKFLHRFKAKGITAERYEKMVCPIGLPSIKGKQPAIIALAVAAQLMCLREGHLYAQRPVAELTS